MSAFNVKNAPLSYQRISDILVGAFEGGSNYWMGSIKAITPIRKADIRSIGEKLGIEDAVATYQVIPFMEGNGVIIHESDPSSDTPKTLILNLESLAKGLDLMAQKHSRHFADIVSENDDATTSDVLVQLAVFGELVYG